VRSQRSEIGRLGAARCSSTRRARLYRASVSPLRRSSSLSAALVRRTRPILRDVDRCGTSRSQSNATCAHEAHIGIVSGVPASVPEPVCASVQVTRLPDLVLSVPEIVPASRGIRRRRQRSIAPALALAQGNGSFVNEPSAELPESPKVARLGQRPLLRKPMPHRNAVHTAIALGAASRVHRLSEPLHVLASAERLRSPG
jgi:hypothetical protein